MKTKFHNHKDSIKNSDEAIINNISINNNTLFSTDINHFGFDNSNINFNNFDKDILFTNNLTNSDNEVFDAEDIFHIENMDRIFNMPSNIDDNEFSKTFQKVFPDNNIKQPFSNNKKINDNNIYFSKGNYQKNLSNEDLSYDIEDYPKLYELENDNVDKTEINVDNNIKKGQKENRTILKSKIIKKRKKKGKSKSFPFKTYNKDYAKNGNNIKKNSKRHQNCRQKIIRNFIQDNLIFWICDGEKDKMLKKLGKKKILFDFKKYKGLKLKDIYSENIKDGYNNNIINKANGNMLIKFHFTFEEAFKVFCFLKYQKSILSKVEKRVLKIYPKIKIEKRNDFFSKLKSKEQYINEKSNERTDLNLFKESFIQILSDFEII